MRTIHTAIGRCFLPPGFPALRGTHVGISLLAKKHAGGTLNDATAHRGFQGLVVAYKRTIIPMIIAVITLLSRITANILLRIVGWSLAGILVQNRIVLVLQTAPRVSQSANVGRSTAIVERRRSTHSRGQFLEKTRAGVAQQLGHARRGGRAPVATSPRGRALSGGRHGIARCKYEHL